MDRQSRRPFGSAFAYRVVFSGCALLLPACGSSNQSGSGTDGSTGARISWGISTNSVNGLMALNPAIASHFFDETNAYLADRAGAIPAGWVSTATAGWGSYALFASDLQSGNIAPNIRCVYYDCEYWSKTPPNEQQDPVRYMQEFAMLAHQHGYLVMETPDEDLMQVPGGTCVAQATETPRQAFLRCQIPAAAALYADVLDLQTETFETAPDFRSWVYQAQQQAAAANPRCQVWAQLSTFYASSSADLFDAHEAVKDIVAGHWLTFGGDMVTNPNYQMAVNFLMQLESVGY